MYNASITGGMVWVVYTQLLTCAAQLPWAPQGEESQPTACAQSEPLQPPSQAAQFVPPHLAAHAHWYAPALSAATRASHSATTPE